MPNTEATVCPSTSLEGYIPMTHRCIRNPYPSQEDEPGTNGAPTSSHIQAQEATTNKKPAHHGWNPGHRHHTCFKAWLQANTSCLQASQSAPTTIRSPCTTDQFQAMVSHLEQLHCHEDGTCNFIYSCSFASNTESDTQHNGEMLCSTDCPHFATAMQMEMVDYKTY